MLRIEYGKVRPVLTAAAPVDVDCVVELNSAADGSVALWAGEQALAQGDAVSMDGELAIGIGQVVAGRIQASSAGLPG